MRVPSGAPGFGSSSQTRISTRVKSSNSIIDARVAAMSAAEYGVRGR